MTYSCGLEAIRERRMPPPPTSFLSLARRGKGKKAVAGIRGMQADRGVERAVV